MKKIISILMTTALILALAACGSETQTQNTTTASAESKSQSTVTTAAESNPQSNTTASMESKPQNDVTTTSDKETKTSAPVQVDESLFNIDVTLNASFFTDMTEEEIKTAAKENGYTSCKINQDGSVTYSMTKKKHAKMLDDMKKSAEEMIKGLLEGEDKVASFTDIKYDDILSAIDIYVDAKQYSMWDSLYAISFYITGAYYQAFAGIANEDIDVVVNFIDNATKEVLDTASYKDYINDSSSDADEEEKTTDSDISSSSVQDIAKTTSTEPEKEDNIPSEYKSALKKAKNYSDMMHMSKAGLYNQLTSEYGEKFPKDAAQYAIDNLEVDYKENALKKAESYSDMMHMSKAGLYDQLTSEYGDQFTEEEAQYAVDNLEVDYKENALKKAESYSDLMYMSKAGLYDQLISEYGDQFTEEEAQYAVDNLEADYKENALKKAKSYQEMDMSKARIYDQLISEYGEQFTKEEAQYAVDNLE